MDPASRQPRPSQGGCTSLSSRKSSAAHDESSSTRVRLSVISSGYEDFHFTMVMVMVVGIIIVDCVDHTLSITSLWLNNEGGLWTLLAGDKTF